MKETFCNIICYYGKKGIIFLINCRIFVWRLLFFMAKAHFMTIYQVEGPIAVNDP